MGRETSISWTDHTFNPWQGCVKVHAGCTNCYAEAMNKRTGNAQWGAKGTRIKTSDNNWRQPIKWNREAESVGERRRVFCASLADVFEEIGSDFVFDHKGERMYRAFDGIEHPIGAEDHYRVGLDHLRADLFAIIDATPWLDWLLLTKRPENIGRMWPGRWKCSSCGRRGGQESEIGFGRCGFCGHELGDEDNWHRRDNVWLGTSISDQATADVWIPRLLKCRNLARVLFVSAEPLLGPIDFIGPAYLVDCPETAEWNLAHYGSSQPLDQIIVGGESGPNRRPMEVSWMQDIADQCDAAGTALFVKQDSAAKPGQQGRIPDRLWARKEFPVVAEAVR